MQGTHVDKQPHLLQPGEYTYHTWLTDAGEARSAWYCCTPNGLLGNLAAHTIVEELDGTITVSPSILVNEGRALSWHGYLEKGVWRQV